MPDSVEMLKKIVQLKPGGEVRTQQEVAVSEIDDAIKTDTNLLLEAPTGSGKALLVSTPILTSVGWKTMGELVAGDKVYGLNGQLINVTKAHDPFVSEELYELRFSNQETIFADGDHLWHADALYDLPNVAEVDSERVESIQSKDFYIQGKNGVQALASTQLNDGVDKRIILNAMSACSVIKETSTTLTVDAQSFAENMYVEYLGRPKTWRTTEMYDFIQKQGDDRVHFKIPLTKPITFPEQDRVPVPSRFFGEWLTGQEQVLTSEEVETLLKLGVTTNTTIPDFYKYSSLAERKQLLAGLLKGELSGSFATNVDSLAKDVAFLARSLGLAATQIKLDKKDYGLGASNLVQVFKDESHENVISISRVKSQMVRCITVDSEDHLFLAGEALIPTHNTLSYLIPLVENDTRAVISTATKQLSEQIVDVDIKFMNKALKELKTGKRADAVLLKGRDNYLCLSKFEDMKRLDDKANSLFSIEDVKEVNPVSAEGQKIAKEAALVSAWAEDTKTGDRSHGPNISEETWRQYSSTNVECPGKASCPFGDVCFAEIARDKAKAANIVITNHAIVALDLAADGQLLGDRDAFVFDELHELDNYMSSAWGGELTYRRLETTYKLLKSIPSIDEKNVEALKTLLDEYDSALQSIPVGLIDNDDTSIKLENFIIKLYSTATKLSTEITRKAKDANSDALKRIYTGAKKVADELADIGGALANRSIETVRWTADSEAYKKRKNSKFAGKSKPKVVDRKENASTISLHAAPLRVGPKLQSFLTEREAIMIGLSATVTVSGKFDIPLHNFGLEDKAHKTVILDSPFDFKKQAMLYVPDPANFPMPVGEDRLEHAKAVKEDSVDFIKAAGGRSLILSTTTYGVNELSEHYRNKLKTPILAQGDGTTPQLVEEFKRIEEASLVGTMGLWHGLDAPGSTLICVIVDKLPFPSPSDPLLLARKNYADKMGRNGFMEIYVTQADWMARQAFGRGVRAKTDKVVVVFYDVRLLTKNYGRAILNNFHGVGLYHDREKVLGALGRLSKSVEK